MGMCGIWNMRIARIKIENFRGIKVGEILFTRNVVLVGENNTGKSTILEAIDLVLGPERLSRAAPIDEHDFYAGQYTDLADNPVEIKVEVVVVDLNDEQIRHFKDHVEWWNEPERGLLAGPPPENTDAGGVKPALRVAFKGTYDKEEDDFVGQTYFGSPQLENGEYQPFRTFDKRLCGFLFLRTLRTGSRALSLERGSLLDIILRLQEKRPQMWEDVLQQLRILPVAEKPDLGITDILSSVQNAIRSFVPTDWADNPHLRVSDLTRESLRRILTVFMGTGAVRDDGSSHAAPFQHQGTGTINTLVLALLSQIAELKQNVIFAMEEPEIAIPPHTQKRIVDSVRSRSAQVLFTSHSPYVLEEFDPGEVLVLCRSEGNLSAVPAELPPAVKPKAYRTEFRTRFCEALLASRILVVEGRTEYDAIPVAARRLHDLHPDQFRSLESLGIAVVNANTESQIALLGEYFAKLGKTVFAICDQQEAVQLQAIRAVIPNTFESPERGFEDLVLNHTAELVVRRFAVCLVANGEWPQHLAGQTPTIAMALDTLRVSLREYLKWAKGIGSAADLLAQCSRDEMPQFIVDSLLAIQNVADPPAMPATDLAADADALPE
jgi:putative ATP-dependent endonuclease of OLD family